MTDDLIELARRAVACPGFRPMRGMSGESGEVIVDVFADGCVKTSELVDSGYGYETYREPWVGQFKEMLENYWLPDLTDPATLGCLLALVREASGCPVWVSFDVEPDPLDDGEYVLSEPARWTVWRAPVGDFVQPCGSGPTEAAALIAALEAAAQRSEP